MAVTLDEVARTAGVSLTTASLVFSGQGRISAETRERVLAAASGLGYQHRRRKVEARIAPLRDIAVLLDLDPEWSKVLYLIRSVIAEFEKTLRQAGYNTVLIPISRSEDFSAVVEKIRCSGAVGVATIHYAPPELLLCLESAGIPVVVMMNSSCQDRFDTVCVDDFQGAYEGTSYLVRNGHRHLAFLECARPDLPVLAVDRYFGFMKAVEEFHLDFDKSRRISLCLDDKAEDLRRLEDLDVAGRGITALFVLDDEFALCVMNLLGRLDIQVPREVSLIAPGDMVDYSCGYIPQVTTMRIDTAYMGRLAAQMLASRLAHDLRPRGVLKVKQHLMQRGSVRDLNA